MTAPTPPDEVDPAQLSAALGSLLGRPVLAAVAPDGSVRAVDPRTRRNVPIPDEALTRARGLATRPPGPAEVLARAASAARTLTELATAVTTYARTIPDQGRAPSRPEDRT